MKAETILYEVHKGLYVNLTNRCPCACTFCLRQTMDSIGGSHPLWLDHEPSFEEVKAAFDQFDMSKYEEVVFCGFGEPTEALNRLLETAKYVKDTFGTKTRINTNGLGNLVNSEDIAPKLAGLIDCVSISLNTPDAAEYNKLVRPKFGEKSYQAMLDFAKECKKYVPDVVLTTVATTLTKEEEEECARICRDLGVRYRIRPRES